MGQIWSAHKALTEWRKDKVEGLYISSILLKNKDVPLFEQRFGYLDYDWLLRVTKDRVCRTTEPVVIKHISKNNLSLDKTYRITDFYMNLMLTDENKDAQKRIYGTRGRYHYFVGETK